MKRPGRNEACWCGSGRKYKQCHEALDDKILMYQRQGHIVPDHEMIKNPEQIQGIRDSAKINCAVLDAVAEKICIGMPTEDIDRIVAETTKSMGGIPAPLNYEGYPKSVCTSINDQVCHGIPSTEDFLKDGDIVNVDCSTIYKGYFSDSSRMFCLGNVSEEDQELVRVAKECMELGIKEAKPWGFLGDIAQVINDHAIENGYSVVREIGGHGVGIEFHEEPWVSYVTKRGTEMLLVPGMVFTIEPMINAGRHDIYVDDENDWTVYTEDGKKSAQWEVTIAITEDGNEVISWQEMSFDGRPLHRNPFAFMTHSRLEENRSGT